MLFSFLVLIFLLLEQECPDFLSLKLYWFHTTMLLHGTFEWNTEHCPYFGFL